MIFVILGSQKFQFNRLVKKIDELVSEGKIKDKVFAQIGYSDYEPQNYEFKKFLDREEFAEKIEEAAVIITHGGTGAIIGAVKKGKKVIAVPRLAKYGEHVDNHQTQIIDQFKELNLIEECRNLEKLEYDIENAVGKKYNSYISNTDKIIDDIVGFIER